MALLLHVDWWSVWLFEYVRTTINGTFDETRTRLTVGASVSVTFLPESLGRLTSLTTLEITYCMGISALPESLGHLATLSMLCLNNCHLLKHLPESLGQLTSLAVLDLVGCYALEALPESLGLLAETLEEIRLSHCYRMQRLPGSFGALAALRMLKVQCCFRLACISSVLGSLTSLTHLWLQHICALTCLPASMSNLINLHTLVIHAPLSHLPASLGRIATLERLEMFPTGHLIFPPALDVWLGTTAHVKLCLQRYDRPPQLLLLIVVACRLGTQHPLSDEVWLQVSDDLAD